MIERLVTYRLSRDERETIYRYSDGDTYCICDTSIPKDIRKLISKGWTMESCDKIPDGTIVAARFTSPVKFLSVRAFKSPATKSKRKLSGAALTQSQSASKNHDN